MRIYDERPEVTVRVKGSSHKFSTEKVAEKMWLKNKKIIIEKPIDENFRERLKFQAGEFSIPIYFSKTMFPFGFVEMGEINHQIERVKGQAAVLKRADLDGIPCIVLTDAFSIRKTKIYALFDGVFIHMMGKKGVFDVEGTFTLNSFLIPFQNSFMVAEKTISSVAKPDLGQGEDSEGTVGEPEEQAAEQPKVEEATLPPRKRKRYVVERMDEMEVKPVQAHLVLTSEDGKEYFLKISSDPPPQINVVVEGKREVRPAKRWGTWFEIE